MSLSILYCQLYIVIPILIKQYIFIAINRKWAVDLHHNQSHNNTQYQSHNRCNCLRKWRFLMSRNRYSSNSNSKHCHIIRNSTQSRNTYQKSRSRKVIRSKMNRRLNKRCNSRRKEIHRYRIRSKKSRLNRTNNKTKQVSSIRQQMTQLSIILMV